mmetsp:Transcript_4892/g.4085  ORF Transcript_4892/g.4085 Transcript_4892/m.4085 type:complete len:117 (-) Transcript_4892:626-976(-)|eukprot:CAMPEP_0114578438 /NCGR_PEP_ID=MMETSP0125-20121206/2975_1 /TAXON_ID=485358 ORGANISM="Aristerostoma sp., Strain ATCC 50986" /NCGR_SAMPLE_ID=MMETSP0125 /ASSEMBLY_ACC=CAM_ASM_000245 /LENGTH=116 /DNA_ID=CAMNT_0001768503 /DNA_START=486 /DNA_END=836 /DNA_ORIENTATION=+
MDPSSLLLGFDNLQLKLADLSSREIVNGSLCLDQDKEISHEHFRAPEILSLRSEILPEELAKKADIYSAAIILFFLYTGGQIPFAEEMLANPMMSEFVANIENEDQRFWKKHEETI